MSVTANRCLNAAADLVYKRSTSERSAREGHGWWESATSHSAGQAANTWLHVASARDWIDGQFVLSVDDDEKERWARVTRDDSAAGSFARPILGVGLDRLSMGDFPWAAKVIFPAFDPTSSDRAAQLWEGRLMQRQWAWATLDGLRPYLDAFFSCSATLVPARSRELGEWVAMLVADAKISGLTLDQLQRFVQHASDQARCAFADALPAHLERLEPDARRALWRAILSPYWRDRSTNVPLPLSNDEVGEMIMWIPALPEVADDALAELRASAGGPLENADGFLEEWKNDNAFVLAHPSVAVAIVEFLGIRRSISPWLVDDAVTVLERAVDAGAPHESVIAAAESLVALSSRRAVDLVERLRTMG